MLNKKRKQRMILLITLSVLCVIVVIVLQLCFFPVEDRFLELSTHDLIANENESVIAEIDILDIRKDHSIITEIYSVDLLSGQKKYYAVSYYKSFIFDRYQLSSFTNITSGDFFASIVPGFPYYAKYAVWNHSISAYEYYLNPRIEPIGLIICFTLLVVINKRRASLK